MSPRQLKILAGISLITLLTALSVIFFRSHYLINWDAGQFALGTVTYSLQDHTPHPPGYYLFVKIGGILGSVLGDVNLAFILLAALAQYAAALFFWRACRLHTSSELLPLAMTAILLLHPFVWYERLVALPYSFELLTGSVLLWATLRVQETRSPAYIYLGAATVGILAGFRPSIVILAVPLILLQWIFAWRIFAPLLSIIIGCVATALWFIPFVQELGGLSPFANSVIGQYANVQVNPIGGTTLPFFAGALFLTLLPFAPGILANIRGLFGKETVPLTAIALLPICWLVSVYSFLHFGDPGYLLGMVPFICYWLFLAVREKIWRALTPIIIGILAFELLLFGTSAFSYLARLPRLQDISYGAILTHDARIAQYEKVVRESDPSTTAFFIVRGQYFKSDGTVDTYPSPEIRVLSYLFPDVRLIDLLGVRNFYRVAYHHTTTSFPDSVIPIPAATKRIIIFADYLHPNVYPRALPDLAARSTLESPFNWYEGRVDSVFSFEFLGFTIRKQ